jgi:RNA polymerase sigma-70 factor (ECF subfamily)
MESTGVLVDADGFTAIYDRHARDLFRFCARRVGQTVAEDVVANTFLVAYERWDRFDPTRANTLAWLYGIAVNLLRRYRRDEVRWYRALARTGVDPLTNAAGVVDSDEQRIGERTDAAAQARRVAGVLAELPARQRDVLLLFAVGELGYGEIASALGMPVGSVRSALHRARAKMRAALGAEGIPDER